MIYLHKKTLHIEENVTQSEWETGEWVGCPNMSWARSQALSIIDKDLDAIKQMKKNLDIQKNAAEKKRAEVVKWQ